MQEHLIDNAKKNTNKSKYVAFAALAVVAVIGSAMYMTPVTDMEKVMAPSTEVPHYVRNMWYNWKAKYEKGYGAFEEDEHRLSVFYSNVQYLQDWARADEEYSYQLGLNKFADLTVEEFSALYTSKYDDSREKNYQYLSTENLSDGVDWRSRGAVNEVQNQGQCGSCWAFSAVAALEGAMFLKTNKLEKYAEQQLVDCSKGHNNGCNGGLMDYAFEWYEQNAADYETDYRYTARDGVCKMNTYTPSSARTSGYHDVPQDNVDQLKAAITKQVVSVAVEADRTAWQLYMGGVLDNPRCGIDLDHGVAAVGYGTDSASGKDYWLVRNSWGGNWGEEGYIRLAMHVNQQAGQCGILQAASYPTV